MLKNHRYWLSLILVAIFALPSWALPKSMIMTMQINSRQSGRPISANAKLWYANQKFRAEVTSNANTSQSPVKISNKATVLMDLKSKIGYMLDESSKTAIKIDQTQMNKMTGQNGSATSFTDPTALTDPAKVKAEIQRQGGKEVGKATILGHSCTIWQMANTMKVPTGQGKPATNQNVTSKVWFADKIGMPLKVEVRSDKMGEIVTMKATNVQVDVPISNNLFGVPSGYKIRNLMDMYKAPR